MRPFITVSFVWVLLFSGLYSVAQNMNTGENNCRITIPEVALVSVRSDYSQAIILQPTVPDEAGLVLDFSTTRKNDAWINYSSILPGNGVQSRSLNAKISQEIPHGLQLKMKASGDCRPGSREKRNPCRGNHTFE
jgi:hypothetical protein